MELENNGKKIENKMEKFVKSYFGDDTNQRYIAVNEMDMNERISTMGTTLLIGFVTLICTFGTVAFIKEKKNRKFILCYNRNGLSFLRVRRTLLDGKVVKEEESFDISVEEIKEINIDEERKKISLTIHGLEEPFSFYLRNNDFFNKRQDNLHKEVISYFKKLKA